MCDRRGDAPYSLRHAEPALLMKTDATVRAMSGAARETMKTSGTAGWCRIVSRRLGLYCSRDCLCRRQFVRSGRGAAQDLRLLLGRHRVSSSPLGRLRRHPVTPKAISHAMMGRPPEPGKDGRTWLTSSCGTAA
jgi:hypothetical protein